MTNFILITLLSLINFSCSNNRQQNIVKNKSSTVSVNLAKIKKKEKRYILTPELIRYCDKTDRYFKRYMWKKSGCHKFHWSHVRNSFLGNPIVWMVYGDERAHKIKHKDTTMIFCGVHGDEITPVKFCYDILNYLDENYHKKYSDKMVIVAPIVTPDSFFKKWPSRTNYKGIDVNRNFPTKDWNRDAIKLWKNRYKSDKRRNPGVRPMSEQEVIFQINLIKRYRPDKLISVHSPLTLLDYDGPLDMKGKGLIGSMANQLLIQMSKKAKDYRIKDYPFFPGSLGNWAGNERDIPTYTLELPTSDSRKSKQYWELFRYAIHNAITDDLGRKR